MSVFDRKMLSQESETRAMRVLADMAAGLARAIVAREQQGQSRGRGQREGVSPEHAAPAPEPPHVVKLPARFFRAPSRTGALAVLPLQPSRTCAHALPTGHACVRSCRAAVRMKEGSHLPASFLLELDDEIAALAHGAPLPVVGKKRTKAGRAKGSGGQKARKAGGAEARKRKRGPAPKRRKAAQSESEEDGEASGSGGSETSGGSDREV